MKAHITGLTNNYCLSAMSKVHYFFRMKLAQIEAFIKEHTVEFEREQWRKRRNRVNTPCPGYADTAAINLQILRVDFDQHAVIQDRCTDLVDYIVEVQFKSFLRYILPTLPSNNERYINIFFRLSTQEKN